MTGIAKEHVIEVLTAEWASLDDLLAGLTPEQWAAPTCLPGWRVTDVVAHLIGTEAMLSGETAPSVDVDVKGLAHVHNDIGVFNEQWVQALRDETPASMLARFREVTARRTDELGKMSQADFDAPSWTPAGQGTYARFMQIRVYDCWMHEQDIRAVAGVPGNDRGPTAEAALDEAAGILGYVIGKRAEAPDGSSVLVELTGPMERGIAVKVDGRAKVVPSLDGPPTATLRLPSSVFLRLCGGREALSAFPPIDLGGDPVLARRVAENLAFTI